MHQKLKYIKHMSAMWALSLGALLNLHDTVPSAEACAGSSYGPGFVELTTTELYGVEEGFLVRIWTYKYNDSAPSTLDDLANYRTTVSVSPIDDLETVIMGTLSEPEHNPLPGLFLWTPTEGSLTLGAYRVRLNVEAELDGQEASLRVVEAETLASTELSIRALTLEEIERGAVESCCQNLDFEACREANYDLCGEEDEYCREICWNSARIYEHRLSTALSWSASEALKTMSHIELVTDLGQQSVAYFDSNPILYKALGEGESLPNRVCAHLEITHMITGERLESLERCLPSSDFVSIAHAPLGREDYQDYELDRWLSCDELTEAQRAILISAGKIEGEPRAGGAEQGGAEQANNQRLEEDEGCQQASGKLTGLMFVLALMGLTFRRRSTLS